MTRAISKEQHDQVLAQLPDVSALNRGPAPRYRPDPNHEGPVAPFGDPNWDALDQAINRAWAKGISEEELQQMYCGFCPAQILAMAMAANAWAFRH